MNTTPTENKQLIARYLQALSVQGKTTEIVARFVSEPGLAAHIKDVESAFPQYSSWPRSSLPSATSWRCVPRSTVYTRAPSSASPQRAARYRRG